MDDTLGYMRSIGAPHTMSYRAHRGFSESGAEHESRLTSGVQRADADARRIQTELREPRHREMTAALDYLSQALDCCIYLEDVHGHLLFSGSCPAPDDWRADFTPLSAPTVRDHAATLDEWRSRACAYAVLSADRSVEFPRVVVPLVYHGSAFAFIHFVSTTRTGGGAVVASGELVAAVADKLYMLYFGEMNEYRAKLADRGQAPSTDELRQGIDAPSRSDDDEPADMHVVCFAITLPLFSRDSFVDYSSVARRVGETLALTISRSAPEVAVTDVQARETPGDVTLLLHAWATAACDMSASASAVRASLEALRWRMVIGIGSARAADVENASVDVAIDRAEHEARAMLSLADRDAGSTCIITRADAPKNSLRLFRNDSRSFMSYARYLAQTLDRAGPELLKTAQEYARLECNASLTADALNVDRRTVSDRLHRISRLTGLKIPSFSSKVVIYLAFAAPDRSSVTTDFPPEKSR